jgi:hypothetical protein
MEAQETTLRRQLIFAGDQSSLEFMVQSGSGTSYGIVSHAHRRGRLGEVDIVVKTAEESQWRYLPMALGRMARLKNWLFDTRWVPLNSFGMHPAQDGFFFDYLVPMWDGESPVWRATYSEMRACFDLKKLRGNPYYKAPARTPS